MAPMLTSLDFGTLTIDYDDTVLRPRRWTRSQSQWATRLLGEVPDGPVLEICTGAGHIGLLAVHGTDRHLVAVDASPAAVAWARRNAARNGITAEVREGDMAAVLGEDETFPLILADPPWVQHAEIDRFPEDPPTAIDGGPDGLDLARRCVQLIGRHLADGGAALLQLGDEGQIDSLDAEVRAAGLVAGERLVVPQRGVVVRLDQSGSTGPG